MGVAGHGEHKYRTSEALAGAVEWPDLRIEHRRLAPGVQASGLTLEYTELVLTLSGRSSVRRVGDGEAQEVVGQPGMSWLCPAGTHESHVEIAAPMESLHLYLPPALIAESALADYDIDPARARLVYTGGLADPLLFQIGSAFRTLLGRGVQATDRLFADGMRAALAAHLIGHYTLDRWRPPARAPSLDPQRLKRVLDFVEARLADEIALDDLAAEACLSPFHFARLFRDATGTTPHRYVTERRVEAARRKLGLGQSSLVEIALDTGFGSQANFIRVFRKATGLTPGQYRSLQRGGAE